MSVGFVCLAALASARAQDAPQQNGRTVLPPATAAPVNPPPSNSTVPLTFQSHGLDYEALTKEGITVMYAVLPPEIKAFSIIQITVTNGSLVSWTVKPVDFSFQRQDGSVMGAVSADEVVESLLARASRNDVIKLQLMYEQSIYAIPNFHSNNGYEKRREAAMAQFVNLKFTAAAAASAIALAPVKLQPGDSTDGAIFFENHNKERTLGQGVLIAHVGGQTFTFPVLAEPLKAH